MPVVRFQGAVVVQLVFWSVGFGAGQGGLFLRLRRCRLIECIVVCVCVCGIFVYFSFCRGKCNESANALCTISFSSARAKSLQFGSRLMLAEKSRGPLHEVEVVKI